MSFSPDDGYSLLVRCPECNQRFELGSHFFGKAAECPACSHQFVVSNDLIQRKKAYPGEKKKPIMSRYQRVPSGGQPPTYPPSGHHAPPVPMQSMQYAAEPNPVTIGPAPPQRVIAGIFGAIALALTALFLIFGSYRGGILDGVSTERRMFFAAFVVVLATLLLWYANPRARIKAVAISLLVGMGVVCLPLIYTSGSTPIETKTTPPQAAAVATQEGASKLAQLREEIGVDPLMTEISRMEALGQGKHAIGLWLRDLREQNKLQVRDFVLRTTGADPSSHFYPRGPNDYLMVVTGIDHDLDELALLVSRLGRAEHIYAGLHVVEVRVDNSLFEASPIEKLSDKENPSFYELNKRELEGIDSDRIMKAINRLAEAPPTVYREEITALLLEHLRTTDTELQGNVCLALETWATDPEAAAAVAVEAMQTNVAKGAKMPKDLIAFLVSAKEPAVIPVLSDLWSKDPVSWEALYGEVGPAAEPSLLARFPLSEVALRNSAVRLLGKVGGRASLEMLERTREGADSELLMLIGRSEKLIRERLGP